MKTEIHPIINSNIKNFCSPNKYADCHVNRIISDKFTFLKSNLIVSNILGYLPKHSQKNIIENENDAYVKCINIENQSMIQMKKDLNFEINKKKKIDRVLNLARCKSQQIFNTFKNQEKSIKKQIQQIHIMRLQMSDKAKQIMSRKEDTTYLGRNIFQKGENFIKHMKNQNPDEKVITIEATRMLMKQSSKIKNRNIVVQRVPAEEVSQMHSFSTSDLNLRVDVSMEGDMVSKLKNQKMEDQKNKKFMQAMKCKSFESILIQQKRRAAWEGFADNWVMGFIKKEDIIRTKKKHKAKKSPKQKYVNIQQKQILKYHDKQSRYMALKNYSNAFIQIANSYKILSH